MQASGSKKETLRVRVQSKAWPRLESDGIYAASISVLEIKQRLKMIVIYFYAG